MSKIAFISLVILSLSACATLRTTPVSGFGSNLPNGAITHNGEIVSYIGLGENDSAVGYVVGNYRMGYDIGAPSIFGIEKLTAVTNVNGSVSALWTRVPDTIRSFRDEKKETVLMSGVAGRAPLFASRIAMHLGFEDPAIGNENDLSNFFVLTVVDVNDRVLIHIKRLAGEHAAVALVYDPEQAIAFLAANLLPEPAVDPRPAYRN